MTTTTTTTTHDPYTEIELYLRRAQEEISAVFGDAEETPGGRPRPHLRPSPRPPPLDGSTSPPKPRLTRRQSCAPPAPPRRRTPSVRKPRRASAPALPHLHDGAAPPRQPRTDPHLQEWSRGLLRDFHQLVDQELRALGGVASESTNGGVHASTPDGGTAGEEATRESGGEEAWVRDESPAGRPVRRAAARAMGAAQSSERGSPWVGETKTYTLPRTGGRRSVSVSGAANVVYRTSTGHPDAPDPGCRLLRVKPRLSRSHSLDEVCPLSPWALHHLALIDAAHDSPTPTPTPTHSTSDKASKPLVMGAAQPEAPPSPPATPVSAAERPGFLRKTGRPEMFNEQWRPPTNGWPEPPASPTGPPPPSPAIPIISSGMSAFTPEDLRKGVSESWAWADEDDACSLTDRPCDSMECPHCRGNATNPRPATTCLEVNPPYHPDDSLSDDPTEATEERHRQERRSEPALAGTVVPELLDSRRHTLPVHRTGGVSRLTVPPPVFTASSWETLPPADELEVELEEKTITEALALPPVPSAPPAPHSPTSSHSLNSSLSSLSHISVHRDHSECDSWPSSPAADPARYIELSFLPGFNPSPVPPLLPSPLPSPNFGAARTGQPMAVPEPPPPITGTLHVAPPTPHGTAGEIFFSVTIPPGPPTPPDSSHVGVLDERQDDSSGAGHAHDTRDNVPNVSRTPAAEPITMNGLDDTYLEEWRPPPPRRHAPPTRQRSFSLDESRAPSRPCPRPEATQVQTFPVEPLDDFLREVESRIPRNSLPATRPAPIPLASPPSTPASTPSTHDGPSPPTVVLDAFTQTSPAPSPPSASRASSDAWLSECGCDDHTSLDPCPSSLALTVSEDDYEDDDDEDDDDWSADGSVSSSSPPHTPASLPHDDSSLSLSESLDTLGLNGESGIGTVSTRPSDSPRPIRALDLSGSNLSSEDTGLENSFERQIRRYIPASNAGGRASGEVYRRRRPRTRAPEQWVRREHQTTQTDPEPPTTARSPHEDHRAFGELLGRGRGGREVRGVRHTYSEPHLDASLTPLAGLLRDVCSEAALPPPPLHSPRPSLTPSVPILPTLTEDKPPIAPNTRVSRPRHLSLSSSPHHHHHSNARSAPTLETRWLPPAALTPATTPSEDSSGETPVLSTRAQSSKELAELEALEACKWLRAAGFPQYAQMYEELQFPLDLVSVERDHSFLERDSLQALFRRLSALNRCARIRLDSARKNKAEESDDDEVALSDNWRFQRPSRRWSRIVQERSPNSGGGGESQGLEVPDEALLSQFKRSGSERLKDGAKAFLRRMESLKNKKKKRHRDGVVISSPKLLDEAVMREKVGHLGCVDLPTEASPMLTSLTTTTTTTIPDAAASTPITTIPATATTTITTAPTIDLMGEDSSEDHSQSSTPLSRARRRRRLPRRGAGGAGEAGGGSGAHSDSEYSPQTWRHHYLTDANSNTMATPAPVSSSPKHQQGGRGSGARPGQVRHTGSLNYGKDSPSAREHFLASIRGGVDKASGEDQASPPPSPSEDRHSVYDNVPLIICNKVYHDFQPEGLDSETSVPEGSGSSESRDSPLPSTHDDEDNDDSTSRGRATVERWHSFNRRSYQPVARQLGTQINGFSSGQTLHLRKRALLRLTALMERYCPSNRSGWNWELPKFMRKMKTPDYRERQVFGVPLQVVAQRTGQPLPPGIQAALQYLRATSLDQVGIFRKPGVRSRIQKLRELHEEGEDVVYSSFSTCDIADMVKTYFRELPEVLVTNKLSEMFIAIFQYLPNEHRLEALQCAVLMLPDENREVLMALLTFLADVAANAPLNQMTASNLAVCLAPSLFHLNVGGSSGSSPLRRRPGSAPEQKDLHENMAAHQCLSLMILQVSQLQCVPMEMLSNCRFTYLEQSQPVCLEDLGMGSPGGPRSEGDWNSYMNACITSLFKEARDKSRGWVSMNCSDSDVEVLYRKVGDGHPLRLWRATTEVEAPPAELLNRVIRERHLWDDSLFKWRVVCRLDRQSEVFQYMCNSMPPRPSVDYCVLRHWRSDLARGSCVVVETSVEHLDAPVLVGGVRGIVLASRYLIQPCGSGKSRITHISRVDMRGRTPEWYNKIYGHMAATHLKHIRQSFQHHASGPESKV